MAPTADAPMPSPKLGAGSIASRWQELQGSGSWAGLLDPLDADLRASVIAYGELAQAAYDGFKADEHSPDAGSCLYSPAGLLAASGVSHAGYYTVTQFLYATCWIGYVAVATDDGAAALGRRDIVVAWRGTEKILDHRENVNFRYTSAAQVLGANFSHAKVDSGVLSVYTRNNPCSETNISAKDQVLGEVRRLVELHKDEETSITVTGHSFGASLATLNAVDIVANGANVPCSRPEQAPCPVTAILFASPHVGDRNFKSAFASFPALRALHVRNSGDVVMLVKEYMDVATAVLHIDTGRSPYLRPGDNIQVHHNLECYLHGLAGYHGDGKDFKMVVDRNVALVNKSADALKHEYAVPGNWWVINHKRKIKGVVGRWKVDNFMEE